MLASLPAPFSVVYDLEEQLASQPGVILSAENAPQRFDLLGEQMKLKLKKLPMHGFPRSFKYDQYSAKGMKEAFTSLSNNPEHPRTSAPDGFVSELETYARSLGIGSIGYCIMPREYIFQGKGLLHRNMIVVTMEMDRDAISKAPSSDTAVTVHRTYANETKAVLLIADHLRANGFSAQACYPLLGLALYPALAQAAGLGWCGAHGLLITPEYGPRVRLAAVATSIENLPFNRENPHQWIKKYCQLCRQCIRKCPVHAIHETPVVHDQLITRVDNTKCLPQFSENQGCAVCIKVCPFSQTNSEILHRHINPQPSR